MQKFFGLVLHVLWQHAGWACTGVSTHQDTPITGQGGGEGAIVAETRRPAFSLQRRSILSSNGFPKTLFWRYSDLKVFPAENCQHNFPLSSWWLFKPHQGNVHSARNIPHVFIQELIGWTETKLSDQLGERWNSQNRKCRMQLEHSIFNSDQTN